MGIVDNEADVDALVVVLSHRKFINPYKSSFKRENTHISETVVGLLVEVKL